MAESTLLSSIGNTPLITLPSYSEEYQVKIQVKQESRNPLGSVKDRVALFLIETAEKEGKITAKTTIIEPTSGNTGLGLAFICAAKKYRLILTMPESMSVERRQMLKHLGAELVLTPAANGMKGAIAEAGKLHDQIEDSFIPNQFENPACPEAHRQTTGPELWQQTDGEIDYFIAGVGTGGTITGVAEYIKQYKPELKAVAVEPADSPVLSGGNPGPHKIQGIGAGFIPGVLNTDILDQIVTVTNEQAFEASRALAKDEGIFCGISSGAAMAATLQIAELVKGSGKTLVTVLPDTGERYLSTPLLQ